MYSRQSSPARGSSTTARPQPGDKGVPPAPAVGVDVADVGAVLLGVGHQVGHHLVEGAGPQAAAEGEDADLPLQLVVGPALLRHGQQHALPDGVAGDHAVPLGLQKPLGLGHRQQDLVHLFGQQLVGDAGEGVLLVDGRLDPPLGRRLQDGAGHIAAGAHHQVGGKVLEDRLAAAGRGRQAAQGLQVVGDVARREGAPEAQHLHGVEGIALPAHQPLLHRALVAHKGDLGVGVVLFDGVGDGDGRVDVPGGAAAR